jgi:hypothetical protein
LVLAFTGVLFADGKVYEGPGNGGISDLKHMSLWTGNMHKLATEIENIKNIKCPSPIAPGARVPPYPRSTTQNTTCHNGKEPKFTQWLGWMSEKVITQHRIRAPWFLPATENGKILGHVKRVIEECSPNCASKDCYYNMHIFEFICADSNDEAAQKARNDSINAIKYIEEEYGDNKRVPAGKICWDGDQLGKAQDERKITAKDIVIAKWFAEIYPKSELKALEKRLTKKHCRKPETAYETKMKEKEK